MNTIDIARENFMAAATHCYFSPKCPTFSRPNTYDGYGAVLKLLSNGNMPSRAAILKKLGLPSKPGYYSCVFQMLLWSKLISYDRTNGYALTLLGRDFVVENLNDNIFDNGSDDIDDVIKDDINDDSVECVELAWKKAYGAAMDAYKAAMEAYRVAISAFA